MIGSDRKPTGIRPLFVNRLVMVGFKLKAEVFGINIAEMLATNRKNHGYDRR
jgi:hypothetical protein